MSGIATAKLRRNTFAGRKRILLAECAAERRTRMDVLVALERYYAKQTKDYLRLPDTTYAAWLEHGPLAELEEVRGAYRDDAVWDRLVETYARRDRAEGDHA